MNRSEHVKATLGEVGSGSLGYPELGSIERWLQDGMPGPIKTQGVGRSLDIIFGPGTPYSLTVTLNPNGSYKAARNDIKSGALSLGGSNQDFGAPVRLDAVKRVFDRAGRYNANLVRKEGDPKRVDIVVQGAVLELTKFGSWNLNMG